MCPSAVCKYLWNKLFHCFYIYIYMYIPSFHQKSVGILYPKKKKLFNKLFFLNKLYPGIWAKRPNMAEPIFAGTFDVNFSIRCCLGYQWPRYLRYKCWPDVLGTLCRRGLSVRVFGFKNATAIQVTHCPMLSFVSTAK